MVIMGEIPTVDSLPVDPFQIFKNGDFLRVDGAKGTVELKSELFFDSI